MTNTSSRLQSLDVFRGLTVMIMTLVNNPGDWGHIYPPLEHATWNGCTVADLVFPSFLFIVGVSIVFAMQTTKQQPENHGKLIGKIIKRALIIAGLGLFMSFFLNWDFSTLRFPGVLQRIAVVYLICGLIFIKSGYRFQAILAVIILVGYHVLMTKVPLPGTGVASLEPETNLGAWLDRTVFTTAHLWKQSKTWDPEGLLSTLPAVATGLLGVLNGTWLKQPTYSPKVKVYGMLAAGVLLAAAGLVWNIWFPINKALWTSSFVLFIGGLDLLFFALCYWLIDIEGYKGAVKPFVVYGVNAITVFVVSGLAARSMNRIMVTHNGSKTSLSNALYQQFFVPHFSPLNASLAWAIAYVLVWMLILWVMYNKRIFIKI
jgi:predicted acyltransferase